MNGSYYGYERCKSLMGGINIIYKEWNGRRHITKGSKWQADRLKYLQIFCYYTLPLPSLVHIHTGRCHSLKKMMLFIVNKALVY